MRRAVFACLTAGAILYPSAPSRGASGQHIVVYRDTGCGCCEGWVAALTAAGYAVSIEDMERTPRLQKFSIAPELASCHTAVVTGYLVEGHVPLAAVAKLLKERPKTRGIALPGMPTGTPGMPGPAGSLKVVFLDAPEHAFYQT